MSDSEVLPRYAGRVATERSEIEARAAEEPWDDYGCFGWLRGVKERAAMLELRKRDGRILAVGYGWLERAEFDPSIGITLHAGGKTIRIHGRDLNAEVRPLTRLFEGIAHHRVPWLCELGRANSLGSTVGDCVVTSIEW